MFTAFGIILLVTGTIFVTAIERSFDGIDIVTVGWIFIVGGTVSLSIGVMAAASTRHSRVRVERHVTPDGRHVVEKASRS